MSVYGSEGLFHSNATSWKDCSTPTPRVGRTAPLQRHPPPHTMQSCSRSAGCAQRFRASLRFSAWSWMGPPLESNTERRTHSLTSSDILSVCGQSTLRQRVITSDDLGDKPVQFSSPAANFQLNTPHTTALDAPGASVSQKPLVGTFEQAHVPSLSYLRVKKNNLPLC